MSNTIGSGSYQLVHGGAALTTLAGGARQYVYGGGVANATTVSAGALEYVVSGGLTQGGIVSGVGAYQVVYRRGERHDTGGIGKQYVSAAGPPTSPSCRAARCSTSWPAARRPTPLC